MPTQQMASGADAIAAYLTALARIHCLDQEEVLRIWWLCAEAAFPRQPTLSAVCSDGTPFEIAVEMCRGGGGLRYLTELGQGVDAATRMQDARQRLERVLEALRLPQQPFGDLVAELWDLPPAGMDPEVTFGPWVAPVMDPGGRRLKLYLNTAWWPAPRAWQGVARLLRRLGRSGSASRLAATRSVLEQFEGLYGIGLENTREGPGRVKLYFRGKPFGPADLPQVGERVGAHSSGLSELWRALLGKRSLAAEDVVLSLTLAGGDRRPGLKVDFSSRVLGARQDEIAARLRATAGERCLDPSAYLATIAAAEAAGVPLKHNVVAIASGHGKPRLSAYLRPILRDNGSVARAMKALLVSRARETDPG